MSGIIRELLKEPNDAYIDYKKALEIFPENTFVQKDVFRLAKALEMTDDLERFKAQFPSMATNSYDLLTTEGELVVFFEDGLVPQKESISIPIPLKSGLSALAFPIYNFTWNDPKPLTIASGSNTVGQTESICLVGALAVKALKEKIPSIVVRQVARSTVKGVAAKAAEDRLGALAGLAVSAYNILSEQADTRCWVSLPESVQVLRVSLPAGPHTLALVQPETGVSGAISVEIKPSQKTIFRVIRVESRLATQQIWPAIQPSTAEVLANPTAVQLASPNTENSATRDINQ